MFINRKVELEHLSTLYRSDRAELFVLYGRRRVGKTELLRAFCAGKPHIFFIATLSICIKNATNAQPLPFDMQEPTILRGRTERKTRWRDGPGANQPGMIQSSHNRVEYVEGKIC